MQQWVQQLLARSGGDPTRAHALALQYRQGDAGALADDPGLRDAEHYLHMTEAAAVPALGAPLAAASLGIVPAYSLAKAGAQALPTRAGALVDHVLHSFGMDPLSTASPPSMGEVAAGVSPGVQKLLGRGLAERLGLPVAPDEAPSP